MRLLVQLLLGELAQLGHLLFYEALEEALLHAWVQVLAVTKHRVHHLK